MTKMAVSSAHMLLRTRESRGIGTLLMIQGMKSTDPSTEPLAFTRARDRYNTYTRDK